MIKLILAVDEVGGIGKNNTMPWPHCSADLKRFKALTQGHVVVMGSNTWNAEGMPKPLPNRINYVLSNSMKEAPGATIVSGDASKVIMNIANTHSNLITWVIGGADIINQCWNIIDEFYITRMPHIYICDVKIDINALEDNMRLIDSQEDSGVTFQIYKR
jgi:dihydrofolate reductase|tara:strand:- start:51 stop:530 length:480 start_codon:yes stop_codon:yes gene_type:complete